MNYMSDTKLEDLDAVEDGRKSPDTTPSSLDNDDNQPRGHEPAIKAWFSRDSYALAFLSSSLMTNLSPLANSVTREHSSSTS